MNHEGVVVRRGPGVTDTGGEVARSDGRKSWADTGGEFDHAWGGGVPQGTDALKRRDVLSSHAAHLLSAFSEGIQPAGRRPVGITEGPPVRMELDDFAQAPQLQR
jgi:hypothetical protein